jgi:hypothetical protein
MLAGSPPVTSTSRKEVTGREIVLVVLSAIVLSVVMNWPLVLNLGETIPKDIGDPLPQSWQVAWGGHALQHQPLEFFQSNQFWPLDDTLAFSDALLGYAPAGLVGEGPEAAVVRYDLLFLFAYALCFAGAYLLARELGLGPAGAAVAGAAYAFAPFRLEQDGHLHVVSSGGIPLAFAAGVRGYRLRSPGWVVTAFLIAIWQFSMGPTLGLPLTYLMCLMAVIAAVIWLRRGRPRLDRRLVGATAGGAALYLLVAVLIALPYLRVADEQADAERPPSTVEAYSGPVEIFATAPAENLVWGGITEGIRADLQNPQEKTLFPGLLILALAICGLASKNLPRGVRIGLGAGIVVACVLALGLQEEDGLLWPYRVAYELLPGWDGMRTPGRLFTFATLGLALLAGTGAVWLLGRGARAPAASAALASLIVLAIAVEGRALPFDPTDNLAQPDVPEAPADVSEVPAPQLHLPATLAEDNRRYLLWSTDGFPDIVNGRSSVQPEYTAEVIAAMDSFPDRRSVATLRREGIASVLLHTDRIIGSPQGLAPGRPLTGLGLERSRLGGGVIAYEVGSPTGPASSRGSGGSRSGPEPR